MALITLEDIERLSPLFQGKFGHALARTAMRVTGIDQLSERYGRRENLSGPAFVSAFLEDLDVHYQVQGIEQLQSIVDGPFVTISNHPYGGLDGLILIDLFGHLRDDYKVMANKFLSMAKTISGNFISVIPKTNDSNGIAQESINGIKKAIGHTRDGSPLGLFPAGAVSDLSLREGCVRDREWQASAAGLIRHLKVPVVPVRFFDRNSNLFYFLGLISWKLRVLRLPREILNKQGQTVHLGIGPAISVEQQQRVPEADFAAMLRSAVYSISKNQD